MYGPLIFITVMVIVFVAMAALAVQAENKRKATIEAAAAELGLACSPDLSSEDRRLFDAFPLANIGSSRRATMATAADSGELRMVLFDYQYTVGSGKNKKTRTYSVVMATSDDLQLPQFSLAPESFFHRLGDFLGFKDIDFPDDPVFSNQFVLKGEDEVAIRNLFSRQRRAAFVPLGQIYIDGRGGCFLCYRAGKQRDAAHLRKMLEEGFNVFSRLRDAGQAS